MKNLHKVQMGNQRVQRARVESALKMQDFEHGQAAVTFIGRLEAEHFVEEIMPNAPPLTGDEKKMLGRLGDLESALKKKRNRVNGTLNENIDKFLWRKEKKMWGAYGVIVEKAAESLMAQTFALDTYRECRGHLKTNGNLVREIRLNVDGTRSMHFCVGKRLTALDNSLFESWQIWKKMKLGNGGKACVVGFVPVSEYLGTRFEDLGRKGYNLATLSMTLLLMSAG